MRMQLKASALAFVLGLVMVALEILTPLKLGMAGVFVVGVAGGLLLGDRIEQEPRHPA